MPRSVLDPPEKVYVRIPAKQSKLKNFLFWFFVIEHLVIILLIVSLTFFYVKTYAFSDFSVLDERAKTFQPTTTKDALNELYSPMYAQVAKIPPNAKTANLSLEITEGQFGSMMNDIKLPHISKIYTMMKPNNELYIWVLPTEVQEPFMADVTYTYSPEKGFDFTTQNVQFGPVPFPPSWVSIPENVVETVLNEQVNKLLVEYSTKIADVKSVDGKVVIDLEVSNLPKSLPKYNAPLE